MPFPYPNFFVVTAKLIQSPDEMKSLNEFGLHMLSTQMFQSKLEHRAIYDGMVLKEKGQDFKGTLNIVANKVTLHYHYGVSDKVADVYDTLEELELQFRGVGAFKLRVGNSGSFLMPHEPLYANFLDGVNVEIVASLNGGAPMAKGVTKSIYKSKVVNKRDIYHSTALELVGKAKEMKFSDTACLDAQALLAHLANYAKSPKALFEDAFGQMGLDEIQKIQGILDSNSREVWGGTEAKIEGVANVICGKMLKGVQKHISDCDSLYKAIVAQIIDLYASFALKKNRFDNEQLVKMAEARASALKATEASSSADKTLADAFAKFNLGSWMSVKDDTTDAFVKFNLDSWMAVIWLYSLDWSPACGCEKLAFEASLPTFQRRCFHRNRFKTHWKNILFLKEETGDVSISSEQVLSSLVFFGLPLIHLDRQVDEPDTHSSSPSAIQANPFFLGEGWCG